jgi:hypothetical protein
MAKLRVFPRQIWPLGFTRHCTENSFECRIEMQGECRHERRQGLRALHIWVVRWVDDWYPGWVECLLTDAFGHAWYFVEKVPIVSEENLDANSSYPRAGIIACREIERRMDNVGRELLVVDTTDPWGVEATSGETEFVVRPDQVAELARNEGTERR